MTSIDDVNLSTRLPKPNQATNKGLVFSTARAGPEVGIIIHGLPGGHATLRLRATLSLVAIHIIRKRGIRG